MLLGSGARAGANLDTARDWAEPHAGANLDSARAADAVAKEVVLPACADPGAACLVADPAAKAGPDLGAARAYLGPNPCTDQVGILLAWDYV